MARKATVPPSRPAAKRARPAARRSAPASARQVVDVRGWLGGIRLSSFMMIMLSLVVLAAFVLVPTLGTYVDQRQRIAALEQAVQVSKDEVVEMQAERDRWADPAYITTQARERLYYVKPGEVVYLVDNDLDAAALPRELQPVSDKVQATRTDWMTQLVRSVTAAGVAAVAKDAITIGVPAPTPSASPSG